VIHTFPVHDRLNTIIWLSRLRHQFQAMSFSSMHTMRHCEDWGVLNR